MLNKLTGGLTAIAILATATASAQTLYTTVNVDRVVEPALRQAVRHVWAPQLLNPSAQDARLTPAEYAGEGTILNSMTALPPLMWADTIEHTPYRGYASLGYFPALNLGANAGYRFVDTDRSAIGAWMQYNGYQYTKQTETNSFNRDVKLSNHYVTVGAYRVHSFDKSSTLNSSLDYTHASVLRPSWTRDKGNAQGANEFNARLAWKSRVRRFGYGVAAKYQYFGFTDSDIEFLDNYGYKFPPIRQSFITIHADLAYLRHDPDQPAKFEVSLEWQHLHTVGYSGSNVFKLYPRFNIGTGAFRATLGLNILPIHFDNHIDYLIIPTPDIRLSWAPASLPLSVYANLIFDNNLMPVSSLFDIDPYISTRQFFQENTTLRADFGINLGAFGGFSAKLSASFGSSGNNPKPFLTINPAPLPVWASQYGGTVFVIDDIASWKLGARIEYAYHSLVDAYVSYEFVPNSNGFPPYWHKWLDGASSSFRVHAAARPMPRLSFGLDYELRANRCVDCYNPFYTYNYAYDLGTASLLDLTASYDLTPSTTLFIRAENLFNCNYLLISTLPAQGIHGLLGATIKF